jgi:HTH-type transcriptional regulator/antitoxin HipB
MATADSFNLSGILRALRRDLDLSQGDLAARLNVSRGTVGRWEASTRALSVSELDRVLALAGWRLLVVDAEGAVIVPMRSDGVVDRAYRRYPAHLDVHPVAPYRDNWGRRGQQWAPGRRWRDRVRTVTTLTPTDHPSAEVVLDHLEAMKLAGRWQALAQACAVRYARMARGEWAAQVPDCFCGDECLESGPCVRDCPCRCEPRAD